MVAFISINLSAQAPSKNKFSLIFEVGSLETNIFQTNNFFDPEITLRERRFMTSTSEWKSSKGYTAAIKMASTIDENIFDSKVSLDFISGLAYKESNTHQEHYYEHGNNGFFECFIIGFYRDLSIKSIEIPLELRSNIQFKNFIISPTFGFGVELPFAKTESLFYQKYLDGDVYKGDLVSTENLREDFSFNINAISKLEISYLLKNNQRFKLTAFYSTYLLNEEVYYLNPDYGTSAKGVQMAYEIPLAF